jgi:hypothetical protein
MPGRYQRLRLDSRERRADAVILHWTGPAGKEWIRKQVEGKKLSRV